jgi:hypothetical protein
VPSVWVENSPLVIHEAQQARVPVITADAGGMAEYVHHEVNGLLFAHRDPAALAEQMQRSSTTRRWPPASARADTSRCRSGDIPDITPTSPPSRPLQQRPRRRDSARVPARPGPWRITFDTNPDTCNLRCIMCEEHSPHSPLQIPQGGRQGRPRLMPIELLDASSPRPPPTGCAR